jgi:hypothetical protein
MRRLQAPMVADVLLLSPRVRGPVHAFKAPIERTDFLLLSPRLWARVHARKCVCLAHNQTHEPHCLSVWFVISNEAH